MNETPAPANQPVSPDAEFSVEIEGVALVIAFLSDTTISAALEADRPNRIFLVRGRAGRSLGGRLYEFDEVAAAYYAAPPRSAPMLGLAPGEDAQGRGAELFNTIWPEVLKAADDGLSPAQCLAPLCAAVARIIASLPPPEHKANYRTFCTNLGPMITAEFQAIHTRRAAH